MKKLRMQIITGEKKHVKIVVLPEETYADQEIQESLVLEAFRELIAAASGDEG
jgi:hypothetical protein